MFEKLVHRFFLLKKYSRKILRCYLRKVLICYFEKVLICYFEKVLKCYLEKSFSPLLPSVPYMARLAKILILNQGIIKKFPMSVATMSQ